MQSQGSLSSSLCLHLENSKLFFCSFTPPYRLNIGIGTTGPLLVEFALGQTLNSALKLRATPSNQDKVSARRSIFPHEILSYSGFRQFDYRAADATSGAQHSISFERMWWQCYHLVFYVKLVRRRWTKLHLSMNLS